MTPPNFGHICHWRTHPPIEARLPTGALLSLILNPPPNANCQLSERYHQARLLLSFSFLLYFLAVTGLLLVVIARARNRHHVVP